MLILLICAIWLAALTLVVAVCRMAARGDRVVLSRAERLSGLREDGPTSWEDALNRELQARRTKPATTSAKHTASGLRA